MAILPPCTRGLSLSTGAGDNRLCDSKHRAGSRGKGRVLCRSREYPVIVDEEELKALGVGIVQADIVNRADGVHHDPKKLTKCLKELIRRLENSI